MITKLHGWHLRAGARMVDFGGWDMPIQYETGPREEHVRVREAAGLFDIDHMGRLEVEGPGALDFLQRMQTWDVSRLAVGRAHYSMLLNDAGGIIDDIFVYHRPCSWLLIVNASNAPKDKAWLESHTRGFDVTIRDRSADSCLVALQGPAARQILQTLCPEIDLAGLGFHHIVECALAGAPSILCTSGYTGEPGYEMLLPAANCETLWSAILAAGGSHRLIPCGLGARDSLRAEACLPLYGNEIDDTTDPLRAGLTRAAVSLEGHDFIGRKALAALALEKPGQVMSGFEMVAPGVPRHNYPITVDGRTVGRVTTGLFSPSTGKYLGMGYLDVPHAHIGDVVGIVIREAVKAARIVKRPFYTSPHWR